MDAIESLEEALGLDGLAARWGLHDDGAGGCSRRAEAAWRALFLMLDACFVAPLLLLLAAMLLIALAYYPYMALAPGSTYPVWKRLLVPVLGIPLGLGLYQVVRDSLARNGVVWRLGSATWFLDRLRRRFFTPVGYLAKVCVLIGWGLYGEVHLYPDGAARVGIASGIEAARFWHAAFGLFVIYLCLVLPWLGWAVRRGLQGCPRRDRVPPSDREPPTADASSTDGAQRARPTQRV